MLTQSDIDLVLSKFPGSVQKKDLGFIIPAGFEEVLETLGAHITGVIELNSISQKVIINSQYVYIAQIHEGTAIAFLGYTDLVIKKIADNSYWNAYKGWVSDLDQASTLPPDSNTEALTETLSEIYATGLELIPKT